MIKIQNLYLGAHCLKFCCESHSPLDFPLWLEKLNNTTEVVLNNQMQATRFLHTSFISKTPKTHERSWNISMWIQPEDTSETAQLYSQLITT